MSDPPRAQSYRDQAKRLREKAKQVSSPDICKQLENIARQYELLADSVEKDVKRRWGLG